MFSSITHIISRSEILLNTFIFSPFVSMSKIKVRPLMWEAWNMSVCFDCFLLRFFLSFFQWRLNANKSQITTSFSGLFGIVPSAQDRHTTVILCNFRIFLQVILNIIKFIKLYLQNSFKLHILLIFQIRR